MKLKPLPTTKRATIHDVARLANVSISTVSRVLNNTAPVANATVRRVERAIDELNFHPDPAARSLAGGRTYTLGILLPELTNPFFSLLISGIEQGVSNAGFDLLIHLTSSARSQRGRPTYPLNEHNTDGLIVYTDSLSKEELKRLDGRNFPLVLMFRSLPDGVMASNITIDNLNGAMSAVTHLIADLGKRRIGFLRELLNNEDSERREQGYRQSLVDHNIDIDESLIAHVEPQGDGCWPVLESWLEQADPIDAIFADCDTLAVRVLECLNRINIRIPEQVAVVGFDDITLAKHLNPPLSTVRSPITEAGRIATELLVNQIAGSKSQSIQLPTELIVRNSSLERT